MDTDIGRRRTTSKGQLKYPHIGKPYYVGQHYPDETLAEVKTIIPTVVEVFNIAALGSVAELFSQNRTNMHNAPSIWGKNLACNLFIPFLEQNQLTPDTLLPLGDPTKPYEFFASLHTHLLDNEQSRINYNISLGWGAIMREYGLFHAIGAFWSSLLAEIPKSQISLESIEFSLKGLDSHNRIFQNSGDFKNGGHPIIITCTGSHLAMPTLSCLTFNSALAIQGIDRQIPLALPNGKIRGLRDFKMAYQDIMNCSI